MPMTIPILAYANPCTVSQYIVPSLTLIPGISVKLGTVCSLYTGGAGTGIGIGVCRCQSLYWRKPTSVLGTDRARISGQNCNTGLYRDWRKPIPNPGGGTEIGISQSLHPHPGSPTSCLWRMPMTIPVFPYGNPEPAPPFNNCF